MKPTWHWVLTVLVTYFLKCLPHHLMGVTVHNKLMLQFQYERPPVFMLWWSVPSRKSFWSLLWVFSTWSLTDGRRSLGWASEGYPSRLLIQAHVNSSSHTVHRGRLTHKPLSQTEPSSLTLFPLGMWWVVAEQVPVDCSERSREEFRMGWVSPAVWQFKGPFWWKSKTNETMTAKTELVGFQMGILSLQGTGRSILSKNLATSCSSPEYSSEADFKTNRSTD